VPAAPKQPWLTGAALPAVSTQGMSAWTPEQVLVNEPEPEAKQAAFTPDDRGAAAIPQKQKMKSIEKRR